MEGNSVHVLERVTAIVAGIAGPSRAPSNPGPDTPLGDDGYWLDSIDVLEVLLACEGEFGIVLDDEVELGAETLKTVRTLADVITRKLE